MKGGKEQKCKQDNKMLIKSSIKFTEERNRGVKSFF